MFVKEFSTILLLVSCAMCASVLPFKPQLDGRIVGGYAINITQAPYQVSLQRYGSHFCGGSIISERWIVTAAHCTNILNNNTDAVVVRAGSSLHSKDGDLYSVRRIVQNPRFSGRTIDYDFSLLELSEPLKFDSTKQPIKLHDFDEIFADNATCLVTGWGNTQSATESRMQLRAAEVPLVNQQKCIDAYSSFGGITPRMICAGFEKEGGKDACQGDSGGPLISISKVDGLPRLVGIVSWGYGCAKPSYPGVYSRVLAGRDWFFTNTGI